MKNAKYIKSTREKQIPSKAILSILKDGYEILDRDKKSIKLNTG